jgi:hypothetical protein
MESNKIHGELDELWARNYTANRDKIQKFPQMNWGRNKVAVLVGASPSLKKNYKVLHELNENYIVITTPTTLKFLLDEGIQPDVVFACEGRDHWLNDIVCDTRNLMLIGSPFLPPEVLEMWQGCCYHYILRGGEKYDKMIQEDYPDLWDVGGGNSLSTAFLWSFKYLMCRRFVFVGTSFCHYAGNYYYDDRPQPVEKLDRWNFLKAMDIHGNIVNTTPTLLSYKVWLEAAMRSAFNKYQAEFVNCTEDGILGVWPEVEEERDGVYYGRKRYIPWMSVAPFEMTINAYTEMFKEVKDGNGSRL